MISVAIAYYNRKKHLINTLNSMTKSVIKDFEVVIADDGSDDEHRIEDLINTFPFLKVIRIEKEDKKHVNPCVPLNIAISNTIGDIVIMQNPECFHYDDIFNHVIKNIVDNKYIAYSTINKNIVDLVDKIDWKNYTNNKLHDLININKTSPNNQWYCHSVYRPKAYNFCAAMTRKDLKELNGFDERYADGIERDDVEFLDRVNRKKMNIVFMDDVLVIHQDHVKFYYSQSWSNKLRIKNHTIYAQTTAKENIVRVNPNKEIVK